MINPTSFLNANKLIMINRIHFSVLHNQINIADVNSILDGDNDISSNPLTFYDFNFPVSLPSMNFVECATADRNQMEVGNCKEK